jgi:hypothetical protein
MGSIHVWRRVRFPVSIYFGKSRATRCTEVWPYGDDSLKRCSIFGNVEFLDNAGAEITRTSFDVLGAAAIGLSTLVIVVGLVLWFLTWAVGCSVKEAAESVAAVIRAFRNGGSS